MIRRRVAAYLMACALAGGSGREASAQAVTQPTPPAPPVAAPAAKHEMHGDITAGFQFQSGVTEAWGTSIEGNVSRPYSNSGTLSGRATYNYTRVVVSDNPRKEFVQTDRTMASIGANERVGKHGVAMFRSLYLRDSLHQIFFRFEQLAGVGLHYAEESGRLDFTLVPGVSFLKEDSYLDEHEGWHPGAGFYEQLALKFNKVWSFDNAFTYRHNFRQDDSAIEANASLTGMIVKGVGLQTKYQYVRETLVPPGVKPYEQTLQLGLQIKF